MNIKKTLAGCIISLAVSGLFLAGDSQAASNVPASSTDPLVSKSYVDDKYNQILSLIGSGSGLSSGAAPSNADTDAIVNEVLNRIGYLSDGSAGSDRFIPVQAYANDIIIGGEGTEIILRSGSAIAYCLGDGLSDITDGKDIAHGVAIYKNHLLIVPRADGRGVTITADAWFIIKGNYQIVSQ